MPTGSARLRPMRMSRPPRRARSARKRGLAGKGDGVGNQPAARRQGLPRGVEQARVGGPAADEDGVRGSQGRQGMPVPPQP